MATHLKPREINLKNRMRDLSLFGCGQGTGPGPGRVRGRIQAAGVHRVHSVGTLPRSVQSAPCPALYDPTIVDAGLGMHGLSAHSIQAHRR